MNYLNEEEKAQYDKVDLMMAYEGVTDTTDKNNLAIQFAVSVYSEKLDVEIH